MLVVVLLACVASTHASQQAPAAGQDPAPVAVPSQSATPVAPTTQPAAARGISAHAANEAVAELLVPVSKDKLDAQEKATDAPAAHADAPSKSQPAMQATEAPAVHAGDPLPVPSPDAQAVVPVTKGATRGVLFRIHPPRPTSLPAELEVAAPAVAEPASVDGGSLATAVATASPPASTPAQPAPTAIQPSYLLGTIHFGTPEEQGIDYVVLEKALAGVETFVNEADLDEAWKPAYDDYRWLSPAQPLSTMVSKDSVAMARSLLPNVRPQDLLRMKPWSVLALLEARGETAGEASMDGRLQRIASASGKRLVHLETLEQQLQALDCVPATEHALVLDERLRAPWILRDESAAAMKHYRTRNLDAWLADIDHMYGLSYAGKEIEQRSRECLLEARNARWVGQLETLFQDGPSFVAVGAVHLVGPGGLLEALRRDGYRIEEVPL